ncbi:MAG: ribokinase, partial [Deinococcota bacterium]|nr:ribokinase [Deinococcota bacterium]
SDYATHPGGKGANQAVAAARAGGSVRLIGRVGEDGFGETLLRGLEAEGIDLEHSRALPGPSGVAFVSVTEGTENSGEKGGEKGGENSIIVAPGANARLRPGDLDPAAFEGAAVLLLQLEIPLETALTAARLGREAGARVVLNLAPARRLGAAALAPIDLLLVNESEAAALLEGSAQEVRGKPEEAARKLTALVPQAVLTLGARGAVWATREESGYMAAFAVKAVDSTAAGDAFAGVLAVALERGLTLAEATRWASAAGALAASREGAQPSLPRRSELEAFLKMRPARPA